jgi:3-oxoacyl-[acyl-carrier protein] reductase
VILNISSVSRAGNMGQSNYSAAKAAVAAMTVVWARELARYGIRSMGIAPGFISTEMVASMKPEALDKMKAMIPLRRLGTPEEIAHTARFIFENDYLTGRVSSRRTEASASSSLSADRSRAAGRGALPRESSRPV